VFNAYTRPRRLTVLFVIFFGNITLNTLFIGRGGFGLDARVAAGAPQRGRAREGEREREREGLPARGACASKSERERERERVCVCLCVF
jgi:hypothetical protein